MEPSYILWCYNEVECDHRIFTRNPVIITKSIQWLNCCEWSDEDNAIYVWPAFSMQSHLNLDWLRVSLWQTYFLGYVMFLWNICVKKRMLLMLYTCIIDLKTPQSIRLLFSGQSSRYGNVEALAYCSPLQLPEKLFLHVPLPRHMSQVNPLLHLKKHENSLSIM